MNKPRSVKGELLLLVTAMIWGSAFIAQKIGMTYVGPFTFSGARCIIGTISLLPLLAIFRTRSPQYTKRISDKSLWVGGCICGLALFLGLSFQQAGLVFTSAGKAGFITALYIILVPLFGLFAHKKINHWIGIAVLLALTGLYLLSIDSKFMVSKGDLLVLCGTVFWAFHILAVDHYSPKVDGFELSFIQFLVAGLLSTIAAYLFEKPSISSLITSAGPILYSGVVVIGVAFTLQIIGQRGTNPSIAAIIMGMESVFAGLFGALILQERMSERELLGSFIVVIAVIITQIGQSKHLHAD